MKKLITAFSGLALIMAVGLANAEEAKGIIKEINTAESWITLEDGTKFVLAEGFSMGELKLGQDVTVSYEMKGDEKVITGVSTE